jgi:hypothetical protein
VQVSLPKEFGKGVRDVHNEPFMNVGECYMRHRTDNLYRYVRFTEDVAEGHAMASHLELYEKTNLSPQVDGGSVYAPAGTRKITEHDATYLDSLDGLPAGEVPFFAHGVIVITGGAGIGQSGVIQSYSDKTMNIDWYEEGQALKTALTGTSDYVVYAPWLVRRTHQDYGGSVNGVVVAETAKKGEYGFLLERGRGRVYIENAVERGDSLTVSTAVTEEGPTEDTGEAEEIAAGDVQDAFATVETPAADDSLAWCQVYCKPMSVVELPPEALISAFPAAEAIS